MTQMKYIASGISYNVNKIQLKKKTKHRTDIVYDENDFRANMMVSWRRFSDSKRETRVRFPAGGKGKCFFIRQKFHTNEK